MNELATKPRPTGFDLSPQNFEQALTFANYLADSDMVPKDFKGKPGNCLIAMQWGMEIGLKPLQAMQNIAVINGRPSLWGDAVIALARNSPACESIHEEDDGHTATCRVKRRGEAEQVRTFSMDDAKMAGLLGKQGPWSQYPKRMRQMRARGFAIRDVFPDVLKGLAVAEEAMDSPARDMGFAEEVRPVLTQTTAKPAATSATTAMKSVLPTYSDEDFQRNLTAWRGLIESGKKSPGQIIAMVASKAIMSEEQIAMINATVIEDEAAEGAAS